MSFRHGGAVIRQSVPIRAYVVKRNVNTASVVKFGIVNFSDSLLIEGRNIPPDHLTFPDLYTTNGELPRSIKYRRVFTQFIALQTTFPHIH